MGVRVREIATPHFAPQHLTPGGKTDLKFQANRRLLPHPLLLRGEQTADLG
jgi:hypothetical protein